MEFEEVDYWEEVTQIMDWSETHVTSTIFPVSYTHLDVYKRQDNKRNLAAKGHEEMGDIDKVLSECKYTVDEVYHTKANQQCMMETFRTYCTKDYFGRLNVVSSTQVPVSYTHLDVYKRQDYGEKGVLIRK